MQRFSAFDTFCKLLILALITQTLVSAPAAVTAAAAAAATTLGSAQTNHYVKRRAIEGASLAHASNNDRDIALSSSDSLETKLTDVTRDDDVLFHMSGESENVAAVKSTKLLPQVGSNRADDYKSSGKLVLNRVETGNAVPKTNEPEWTSHLRGVKTYNETLIAATEQVKVSDLETSATTEAKVYSHGNIVAAADDFAKGLATGGISNGLDEAAMQHNQDEGETMQQLNRDEVNTTTEAILPEIERVAIKPPVNIDVTTVAPGVAPTASTEADASRALQHSNENVVEEVTTRDIERIVAAKAIVTTAQPLTLADIIMAAKMQTGEFAQMRMPSGVNKTEKELESDQSTISAVTLAGRSSVGGGGGGTSSSEKRAKFINDNSTNAQQMNLPDAAEVWSLAGLKTVPKANNTESENSFGGDSSNGNLANASQEKGNEIAIETTERSLMNGTSAAAHSNSEKNLLDWTQIMMHGGFEGKRFNNMVEGGTTLRSIVAEGNTKEINLERVPTEKSTADTTTTTTTEQNNFNAPAEGQSTPAKVQLHELTEEGIAHSSSTHLPDVLNEVAQPHSQATAAPTLGTMLTSSVTHSSADNTDKQLESIVSRNETVNKTAATIFTTETVNDNESAGKMDDNNGEHKTNVAERNSIDVVTSTMSTATPLPTLSSAEHMPVITQTALPVVELQKSSAAITTTTAVPPPITQNVHSDGVGGDDDDYDYGNDSGNTENGNGNGNHSSMTTTTKALPTSAVAEKVNIVNMTNTNNTHDDVILEQRFASETSTTPTTKTTIALAVSTLEASEASSGTTVSAVITSNVNNATTPPTIGGILQHEKNRLASETTTNRTEIGNGSILTTAPTVLPTISVNTNTNQPNINAKVITTTTEINQFGNEVELEANTERITGSSTIKTHSTTSNSSTSAVDSVIGGHDSIATTVAVATIPTVTPTPASTSTPTITSTTSSINELLIPAAETSTKTSVLTTTVAPKIIATADSTTSAAPITSTIAGLPVSPEPTTTLAAATIVAGTETVVTATSTPTIRESFATATHLPTETTTSTTATPTSTPTPTPTQTSGSVADINSTEIATETTKTTPVTIIRNKPDEPTNGGGSRDTESSIETNAIDQLEQSTVKTPISAAVDTATTVTYKELERAGHNTEPTNALGEVDTHNAQNFSNNVATTTVATNTMATTITQRIPVVPIVNATTITTTTIEPPLINLLDDSTTTTTWQPTITSSTISSIATKIQEIYSVFSSTPPSIETVSSEINNTTAAITTANTIAPTAAPPPPPPVVQTTSPAPEVITTIPTTTLQSTTDTILHGSIGGGGILGGNVGGGMLPPTHLPGMQHPRSPGETDVNVIIAITVSVIGVIALILLVAFLYLIRKRQKQMSYGQRCRPVSLDAYSLDNVSVLGSVRRKGALRASKRSYGNIAFDDPSLRHNVLTASELAQFVGRRSSIFEEFRDVPQITARADEVPHGCEDKNRYANVIPLPETRVILQQLNDDEKTEYINANYVRGPKDAPNYYIATQAPLETTVADFWRMIWEQQSRVIIQATDLIENGIEKCAEYLPPSVTLDNHATYGDFQITLKHREVKDKYAISTLMLKHIPSNENRELTHYWYKWPETGVPSEEAPIIAMLLEARSSLKGYANEQKDRASSVTLRSESSGDLANSVNSNSNGVTVISVEGGGGTPERKDDDARMVNGNGSGEINGNVTTDKLKVTTTLRNQGPLTIHCSPGIGRTGTIIACDMAIRSLETPKRSVDIPQIVYYVRRGRASAVQTKEQYEFIYKVAHMYATKITNLSNDN